MDRAAADPCVGDLALGGWIVVDTGETARFAVISPELPADHAVDLGGPGSDHDDRNVASRHERATNVDLRFSGASRRGAPRRSGARKQRLCRTAEATAPAVSPCGVYAGSTCLRSAVFGRHRGLADSLDSSGFARLGTTGDDMGSTLVMKSSPHDGFGRLGAMSEGAMLEVNPQAAVLFDEYDEDWRRLRYVILRGRADILEPGRDEDERARALAALREKYPQYRDMPLEGRSIIRVTPEAAASWSGGSNKAT